MIRTIEYTVSDKSIIPASKQWGGMQFEDNASEIIFKIPETDGINILWRIDFDSSSSGYDPGECLTVVDQKVSRLIPYSMTRYGGEIQVTLVGTEVDSNNEAVRVVYSLPATVYFTDVEQHEEYENKAVEHISAAEKSAVDAAKVAEESARLANQSAVDANTSRMLTEEAMISLSEGTTIIFMGGDAESKVDIELSVDSTLSEASENPIGNKAVKQAINNAEQKIAQNCTDIKSAQEKIANLEKELYIVERGISGLWEYEKWSDGTAKCWGRKKISCNFNVSVNNSTFYISDTDFESEPFPFEFIDEPIEITSVSQSNVQFWPYLQNHNNNPKTHTGKYSLMRWSQRTELAACCLDYLIIGKWK